MSYLVVLAVAFVASGLTFFSGFGLGTLLLPAFALFFPVERAVALTAVVHFVNGLFKLALVARHADLQIVLRFGVPALLASLAGAWLLLVPRLREVSFGRGYLPLGGALSGFFGGLSGMQGALRSAFLARADLSKEAFIATGVAVACLIDVSRLGVYSRSLGREGAHLDYWLLVGAVLAAFAGSVLGNRFLKTMTMRGVRLIVAGMLLASLRADA